MTFRKPLIPHITTLVDSKYVYDLLKLDASDSYQNTIIQQHIDNYKSTKDPIYRNLILMCYGKVVLATAKKYQNNNVALSDLFSEAFIAINNAISSYDGSKGIKFITYATWVIERHLRDILDNYNSPVYVPKYVRNNIKIIYKYTCESDISGLSLDDIIDKHYQSGDISLKRKRELEEFLNIGVTSYQSTLTIDDVIGSFNDIEDKSEYYESQNFYKEYSINPQHTNIDKEDFNLDLERLIEDLDEKERLILVHFFGLFNTIPKSYNELSVMLFITTERVRQLKERALFKIKKSNGISLLAKYL